MLSPALKKNTSQCPCLLENIWVFNYMLTNKQIQHIQSSSAMLNLRTTRMFIKQKLNRWQHERKEHTRADTYNSRYMRSSCINERKNLGALPPAFAHLPFTCVIPVWGRCHLDFPLSVAALALPSFLSAHPDFSDGVVTGGIESVCMHVYVHVVER